MQRIEFTVPLALPAALSPNGVMQYASGRGRKRAPHWSEVNRGRQLVRTETAKAVAVYAPAFRVQHVRVSVTLLVCRTALAAQLYPAYRPRDPGNLVSALKPFFDGLVQAGVAPDDDFAHFELGVVAERRVAEARAEGLLVLLEEVT